MSARTSKVTIHMAASLDGYVAKKNGDYSWLHSTSNYEHGVELSKEDIANFLEGIDCYLIGSKTYELALTLGWPYGDKPVYVLTSRKLSTERVNVKFISGDLKQSIEKLRSRYPHIWVGGGPLVIKDILAMELADELIVSIMPVVIGDGVPFFQLTQNQISLKLQNTKAYKDGMVEITYEIIKDQSPKE